MVSHLQFTDDTLIYLFFWKQRITHCKFVDSIKVVLLVSGLHINMSKSQLLGVNVDEDAIIDLAASVGCYVGVGQ